MGTGAHDRCQHPRTIVSLGSASTDRDCAGMGSDALLHCDNAICECQASPHKDKYNEKCSNNLLLPCSSFKGGQLFVESAGGAHQLQPGGVTGHIFSTQEPTIFSPCCTHATLPWQGAKLMLIAYHTGMTQHLCQEDRHKLAGMGFVIGSW